MTRCLIVPFIARRAWLVALATASTVGITACGGEPVSPEAPPSSPGVPTAPPTGASAVLSARINGTAWSSAPQAISFTSSPSELGASALSGASASPSTSLSVFLGAIDGPGTYPMGVSPGLMSGGSAGITIGSTTWSTPGNGASGTLVFTSITPSRVAGTFAFRAVSLTDRSDTLVVTDGRFDVPRGTFAVRAPNDRGNSMRGTVNGMPFNAGIVNGESVGPILGIRGASDGLVDVSLTLVNVSAVGSYPLRVGTIIVVVTDAGGVLGLTAQDAEGVVTITEYSRSRIAGRFSGRLSPLPGGSPIRVDDLEFQLRVAAP